MLSPRCCLGALAAVVLISCHRPSPLERKIVGAWSWTYIEGQGRMVFTADHRIKEGFEPQDDPGRPLRDDDFTYLRSGTWHLEGDVLVTETDNTPWIAWFDETFRDDPKEEQDRKRPKLDKQTGRKRIARIDDEKMTFDDGYYLKRDHRVK